MAIDHSELIDGFVGAAFWVPRTLAAPIPGLRRYVDRRQHCVRLQLRNARVVGELAVRYGRRRVSDRLAGEAEQAPPPAEPVTPPRPIVGDDPPFDDYDTLPAAHIVKRLARLDIATLEQVAAYETAHRNRRTVLGKVDQLLGR